MAIGLLLSYLTGELGGKLQAPRFRRPGSERRIVMKEKD
jgi:hypothetical protein